MRRGTVLASRVTRASVNREVRMFPTNVSAHLEAAPLER